ncbi:MAG TPA: hypothetical protein VIH22_01910 [Cyclobacteriaceae bacterium]|jgi:hypothetical protein
MARHNVFFNLPQRELGKVDALFYVYSDDRKTGTLTISKGAIEWYPANAKTPYKLSWKQFDQAIREFRKK